jgi:hypothetical protein
VLAGAGARVALIVRDRPHSAFAVGETIPAETRHLLDGLGLNCLSADLHLPSAGTVARWGSDVAHRREAILSPFGCGWHLDRPLFERQLIDTAVENGAVVIEHCARIETKAGSAGWEFRTDRVGRQICVGSDYAIDCTGRTARLAVDAGARRQIHDKLIAIWCVAEETSAQPDLDQRIYVESAPDGWFYSARIPNRRRALAYFTDGDLRDASRLRSAAIFEDFVAKDFSSECGGQRPALPHRCRPFPRQCSQCEISSGLWRTMDRRRRCRAIIRPALLARHHHCHCRRPQCGRRFGRYSFIGQLRAGKIAGRSRCPVCRVSQRTADLLSRRTTLGGAPILAASP